MMMGDAGKRQNTQNSIRLPEHSEGTSSRETRLAKAREDGCCCCTMKGGATWIALMGNLFVLFALGFTIALFWDTHVHWWYVLINFFVVIGLGLTAVVFTFTYSCGRDSKASRRNLATAQLLILFMWVILSIWNIVYVNEFISERQVNLGFEYTSGEEGGEQSLEERYWTMEKSTFVLFNFCWGILMTCYFYYMYYIADTF